MKIRASEINSKVATFGGSLLLAFSNTREILSLLSKGRYFRRMVTLETGDGITQVVKAPVTISQNTIQDYARLNRKISFRFPCHLADYRIIIEARDIS